MIHEEMDGRNELQLLPGTKKRLGFKVPGENRFLYVGSAIFGAVLVTMFALSRHELSLNERVKRLNNEFFSLEQKRNKKDEMELRLTKDRLEITSNLVKKHVYWTQVFSWLENLLQRETQIEELSVATDGKLKFSAKAVNYTTVARQVAAFLTDDKIKDLALGKITSSADGFVEFSMELTLDLPRMVLKPSR